MNETGRDPVAEIFYLGSTSDELDRDLQELADSMLEAGAGSAAYVPSEAAASRGVELIDAVYIYLGVKAADVVTEHTLGRLTDAIEDKALAWGRALVSRRKNHRALQLAVLDEDGIVVRSWHVRRDRQDDRTLQDRGRPRPRPKSRG